MNKATIVCLLSFFLTHVSFASNLALAQATRLNDHQKVNQLLHEGVNAYDSCYRLGMRTAEIDFAPYAYDKDFIGTPPFFFIRSLKMAKLFAQEHGVSLRKKKKNGSNFIHHLISDGTIPLAQKKALIRYAHECGVEVNGQDNQGETPLHHLLHVTESLSCCCRASYVGWGCGQEQEAVIQIAHTLLELGAKMNVVNDNQETPTDKLIQAPRVAAALALMEPLEK